MGQGGGGMGGAGARVRCRFEARARRRAGLNEREDLGRFFARAGEKRATHRSMNSLNGFESSTRASGSRFVRDVAIDSSALGMTAWARDVICVSPSNVRTVSCLAGRFEKNPTVTI